MVHSAGPKSAYNQNQFGGSAGLPLIKDKLFIFGDYQGNPLSEAGWKRL